MNGFDIADYMRMLENCVTMNGGKIEGYTPRTITLPKPVDEMPWGSKNAARELELEWDYVVVIEPPLDK